MLREASWVLEAEAGLGRMGHQGVGRQRRSELHLERRKRKK